MMMRLKAKLLVVAAVPLLLSLALIATAVLLQQRALARQEHESAEGTYITARRAELENYVQLAVSMINPLVNTDGDPAQAQAHAMQLLRSLDYGNDGYFFVYDMQGTVLMHPRQPNLVGQNLSELRDPKGNAPIKALLARARAGGGYVEYLWRRPSTGQIAPKLGYVVQIPKWNWMIGTGLYRDDIDAAIAQLDSQASSNIGKTLLLIALIACGGVGLISLSSVWLSISDHRVANAKLQLLARKVVRFQEDERAHLARELHDGATQTMVSAKLLVESAIDQLERESRLSPPALDRALRGLQESLNEVRRIAHRLRPAMLDELGLPAALELLARETNDVGAVRVDFTVTGRATALPEEVKTALFRVSQEAIVNVRKHAQASNVCIELTFVLDGLQLSIGDDGCGFNVDQVQLDPNRGIGLRNMRERLASIGGCFEVQSGADTGTVLLAKIDSRAIRRLG